MSELTELLDQLYKGQERMSRDEIHRRAVSAGLTAADLAAVDALPEGQYAQDEVGAAIEQVGGDGAAAGAGAGAVVDAVVGAGHGEGVVVGGEGVPAGTLSDDDLRRELATAHRTRHEAFLHGSAHALDRHTERTVELESEFLRRFPEREIDRDRLREGARDRT